MNPLLMTATQNSAALLPVAVLRAMAVVAINARAWRLCKYRAMFVAASF